MLKLFIIFIYPLGGLGIGDWALGIGDWAQSPIPNPQSPNCIFIKMSYNYKNYISFITIY